MYANVIPIMDRLPALFPFFRDRCVGGELDGIAPGALRLQGESGGMDSGCNAAYRDRSGLLASTDGRSGNPDQHSTNEDKRTHRRPRARPGSPLSAHTRSLPHGRKEGKVDTNGTLCYDMGQAF